MMYYARTNEKSYLNAFKGEPWQAVEIVQKRFPSGLKKCAKFPNGFTVKLELCEVEEF